MVAPLAPPAPRPMRPALAPLATGAMVASVLIASAGADEGIVLCPFRRCTGGYCPGCGATRAANRFIRGDIAASWTHHPWIVLAAMQVVVLGAVAALMGRRQRQNRLRRLALPLLIANGVLMIGIWAVRLSAGAIPTGWL